jgi:glutathione synthase/RimK-type ligase-like ATP-grasp enzyme
VILVCGIPTEAPLRLVLEAAQELGVDHALLNQREAPWSHLELAAAGGSLRGRLVLRGREIPLESVRGVYLRLMDHARLPEQDALRQPAGDPEAAARGAFLQQTLVDWLEVATCRVMNRARAMASNVSKPYQAQLVARCGFAVPETLVTNDPDEARAFWRRHRRVVFKSISAVRSIVRELRDEDAERFARLRFLPTQFQTWVEGVDVRVHVAGDEVFATEVESDAIDYRYPTGDQATELRPTALPAGVERRCRALARLLDLPLCGIDLRRGPAGRWTCFEVNPSPAFSYYQGHTSQPISHAIVRWLDRDAPAA